MSPGDSPGAPKSRPQWPWVLLLIVLGCFRVFLMSAAFPFFGNVDEMAHLDTIYGHAQGMESAHIRRYTPESARLLAVYYSPEFLNPPAANGAPYPRPGWESAGDSQSPDTLNALQVMGDMPNHDSTSPPLYYELEAGWRSVGLDNGLAGLPLLYWLRFLNVPLYAAGMLFGWLFCRDFLPETPVWRWGVLVMLAAWPQDVFYSLNNDVLSFPLGGAVLFFLGAGLWVRASAKKRLPGIPESLGAGLALALGILTKLSNLPLFLPGLLAQCVSTKKSEEEKSGAPWLRRAVFALAALVPPGIWAAYDYLNSGDLTGSAGKVQMLGWTIKPFREMFHNPVFTVSGAWSFWSGLMQTWWRGELYWHGSRLASPVADDFFIVSSTLFLGLTAAELGIFWWKHERKWDDFRRVQAFCLLFFFSFVAYLLALGLPYDFHNCVFPSRAYPYFTTGRLMTAAMVPFAVVYLRGFTLLCGRCSQKVQLAIFCLLMLWVAGGDLAISGSVFTSEYNWFHLQKPVDPVIAQLR